MSQNAVLSGRLARYSAVAAGLVPFAGASAAIIGQTGLNVVVNPGPSVGIDFGPGFGEVFAFQVAPLSATIPASYYYPFTTFIDRNDAVVQFNPYNTGGAYAAFHAGSVGGGNPARLPGGYYIGYSAGTFNSMTSSFGTFHDLVQAGDVKVVSYTGGATVFSSSYSVGDWAGGQRGYLGFAMYIGLDTYFGWFDVEAAVGGGQLIIHGWGLNTTSTEGLEAGQIPAPAAGGLAALALGAAGIRRKRRTAA